jgi:hypothetical protein
METIARQRVSERASRERALLVAELEEALQNLRNSIPTSYLSLKLRDFLELESLENVKENVATGNGMEWERRMTRSQTAKLSLLQNETDSKRQTMITEYNSIVTATPKFHPGLPETPAAIRNRQRKAGTIKVSEPKSSNIFADGKHVTRATIRSSIMPEETSSKRKTVVQSGLLSVELADGKVLDVDITASPSKLVAEMGKDAVNDMKSKMQAYATQLRSFFKRLKIHNK